MKHDYLSKANFLKRGPAWNSNNENKKAGGINEPLELHKSFFTKKLTRAIFLLALAVKLLGTSQFFLGFMKWQHAVILEPICETDSIIIFLPAQRTGLLTPLLTCFTLVVFSFLLGQIILSPTPLLPFTLLDKIILSPIPLPSSLWTK